LLVVAWCTFAMLVYQTFRVAVSDSDICLMLTSIRVVVPPLYPVCSGNGLAQLGRLSHSLTMLNLSNCASITGALVPSLWLAACLIQDCNPGLGTAS
jgi:hypothetical protein